MSQANTWIDRTDTIKAKSCHFHNRVKLHWWPNNKKTQINLTHFTKTYKRRCDAVLYCSYSSMQFCWLSGMCASSSKHAVITTDFEE